MQPQFGREKLFFSTNPDIIKAKQDRKRKIYLFSCRKCSKAPVLNTLQLEKNPDTIKAVQAIEKRDQLEKNKA